MMTKKHIPLTYKDLLRLRKRELIAFCKEHNIAFTGSDGLLTKHELITNILNYESDDC